MSLATRQAERMIDRARDELARLMRRGIIKIVSAAYSMQAEAYSGERFEAVELWQQFGMASRPPAGGEVLIAKVDNDGDQPIAIATTDRAHRPSDLSDGDAALYGKSSGGDQAQARARADKDLDLVPGSAEFVNVGGSKGDGALEAALLGVTYNAAESTMLGSLAAAFTALAGDPALLPPTAAACTTAAGDIATFLGGQAGYLTARVKVK